MKRIPYQTLVLGLGGAVLFGYMTVKWFIDTNTKYLPEDIVLIEARLALKEEIRGIRGDGRYLQLWLQGQPLPFRGSCPYPDCYDSGALSQLDMDVPVKIGILRSDQSSPYQDYLRWQAFHRICCLEINGRSAFSLDEYNEWTMKNAAGLRILGAVLFLFSLVIVGAGLYPMRKTNLDRPQKVQAERTPAE